MGYLICDNCDIYFEVEDDFDIVSFDICEQCGNKLKLYDSFDDYYNEYSIPNRESIVFGEGYAEKKSSKYNNMTITGAVLGLIGLIGFLAGFSILIILLFFGFLLGIYGYGNSISWNKGIKGESIVAEYLNQLPEDYFVFNDVKFPGSWGNLDHIIIGPNGVFVIETKNITGFFVIDNNEWYYKKHSYFTGTLKRSISQPGKQVLKNTKALKNFLDLNGVNVDDLKIYSIVTLIENNYKIKTKPQDYNMVNPSSIVEFIINNKKEIEPKILNEIAILLEPHCIEITFIKGQKIDSNEIIDPPNNLDIEDIFLHDPVCSKRVHSAYLMGQSRDPKYVEVLCYGTNDKDNNVRQSSILALGNIGDIRAEDTLIELLTDQNPKVRQYTVNALGKMKSKKGLKNLIEMKNDEDSNVVKAVEIVLYGQANDKRLYKLDKKFAEK